MASLTHYAEVQTIPTYESASILFTTQLCAGAVRTDVLHRMMRTIAAFHRVREHRPCRRIAPHVARGRCVPPRARAPSVLTYCTACGTRSLRSAALPLSGSLATSGADDRGGRRPRHGTESYVPTIKAGRS